MTTPDNRVQLVREESERFKEYLNGLSVDALSKPSACEGWRGQDVVAHLTMAVGMFSGNISRGVAGDSSPMVGASTSAAEDMVERMRANAQRAIDFSESQGDQLLPGFSASCDDLDQLFSSIAPGDWDKPCYHPAGIISPRIYVNLRITELIVHEWDIRSRLESSAHLSGASLAAMIDVISAFIIGGIFNPGSKLTTPTRYRFELTGSAGGSHDIVVGDGRARMGSSGTQSPDVTFTCDGETFVLVAYGRVALAQAISDGRITVQGDQQLAAQFGE